MAEEKIAALESLSPPKGSRPDGKRRGRGPGSGLGKTSGRGHKGQKSRTGSGIPAWFEGGQMPLHRRIPKRGFAPRDRTEYQVVNVRDLAEMEEGEVDPAVLKAHGLIGSSGRLVKILGDGELTRAVTVRAHAFSASAREKIESAGGAVETLE